jgi:hypothetical protein
VPQAGKPLVLGFIVTGDAGATFAAVGANLPSQSSAEAEKDDQIVVDSINAHGGMAGHQVIANFATFNAEGSDWTTEMQSLCTHFTEDVHAYAVIEQSVSNPPLPQCLASHHTIYIDEGNSYSYDPQQLAQMNGYHYRPEFLDLAQIGIEVDALTARGYLGGHHKIGIALWNSPEDAWAEKAVVIPALARHHLSMTTDFAFSRPTGVGGLSVVSAQASSAALRFRTAGVDIVLNMDTQAAIPFFFLREAQSQNYYPRSFFSSFDVPSSLPSTQPAQELAGSAVVGWYRPFDTDFGGTASGADAAGRACINLMTKGGAASPNTTGYTCSAPLFLQALLDRAPSLDGPAVRLTQPALGTSFTSAGALPMRFRPGHSNGVAYVRIATFNNTCTCFRYGGPLIPAP